MRYVIRDQRQLRALALPIRQTIVDVVEAAGPCALKDIAAIVHRPVTTMYHHVNALCDVGLLTERPARSRRGRPGSLFDVPGRPMTIQYEPGAARTGPPIRRIVRAMARTAARDFASGYSPGIVGSGKARQLWAARSETSFTTAELRAVNRALSRLLMLVDARRRRLRASARRYSLTFVLAPLVRRAKH